MPNYEDIIQQSQENVKSLSERLKELDNLYQDIHALKELPAKLDGVFQQIVKLSEDYLNTVGSSVKIYLDGSNTLFTEKLIELSDKVLEFKKEVERLEKIDLDKEFGKLQKTLSEIFGAINEINLTLTSITQSLISLNQSIGEVKTTVEINSKETKQLINNFSESTYKHLIEQDQEAKSNAKSVENKIESLSVQNDLLKKEIKTNRLIYIIGIVAILVLLIYLTIK